MVNIDGDFKNQIFNIQLSIYLAPVKSVEGLKSWWHGTVASRNVPEMSQENMCQVFMLN